MNENAVWLYGNPHRQGADADSRGITAQVSCFWRVHVNPKVQKVNYWGISSVCYWKTLMFYWREALIHRASRLPFMQHREGEHGTSFRWPVSYITHAYTHRDRKKERASDGRTHTNAQKQLSGGLLHSTDQTITPYAHTPTRTHKALSL